MFRCKFICFICAVCLMLGGCTQAAETAAGSGEIGCYPADDTWSIENAVKQSSLVAAGTVTAKSYLQILPVGSNEPLDFIDYSFEIRELFRGSSSTENNAVTIRVPASESNLQVNKKYLVFLYQPHMGGSYHTKGDYYYITHGNHGIYDADTQQDIVQTVMTYNEEYPINEYYAYEHAVQTAKNNVESGVMTPEYFDGFLQEIQTYAQITMIE